MTDLRFLLCTFFSLGISSSVHARNGMMRGRQTPTDLTEEVRCFEDLWKTCGRLVEDGKNKIRIDHSFLIIPPSDSFKSTGFDHCKTFPSQSNLRRAEATMFPRRHRNLFPAFSILRVILLPSVEARMFRPQDLPQILVLPLEFHLLLLLQRQAVILLPLTRRLTVMNFKIFQPKDSSPIDLPMIHLWHRHRRLLVVAASYK
jgi:hypothetical protein